MEDRQLGPLINAAVLADEAHQMLTQQQLPQTGGLEVQPQGMAALPPLHLPQQQQQQQVPQVPPLHNVVHTINPPVLAGQPLQSHPTLPQLPQIAAVAAASKKTPDHTNYGNNDNNPSSLSLNHPQNEAYKLKTNQYLLESSSRLEDAVSELSHYTSVLSSSFHNNSKSTKKKSKAPPPSAEATECLTNIDQSIIPLLKLCANAMKDAGKYFAPFPGTANIHNRNDAERKRKLVLQEEEQLLQQENNVGGGDDEQQRRKRREKKRPALLMINEFVERSNLIVSTETTDDGDNTINQGQSHLQQLNESSPTTTTTNNKRKRKTPTTITESILILQPRNNSVYTKSEALAICKRYRKGSRERGLAIRAMIHKKFVLASRKTLYRLLQHDEEGRVLLENGWLGCGRPMKVDLNNTVGDGERRSEMVVDSSLTFEDLDRGEENRILVELGTRHGGGKNDDEEDDGEEEDEEEEVEQQSKKRSQKKKGKKHHSIPPPLKSLCSAPGCTNQISRRGLCVKHGMQDVDPKIIDFPLPPPRDGGTVYTKSECVEIAKQYKKGSSQRRLALEAMIYRGYAKNSLKSLYRLLLNDEKGIPITDENWRGMGCPSVLSATEIDEVIERIKREDIRLNSDDDVRQLVLDALKEKGVTDESKLKFSATTVKNYGAILKSRLSAVYWKNDIESQQQGMV